MPGPAAYGRGGDEPTVTDANLVLGRLDKDNFLGGSMALDEVAARRAIAGLAEQLKLDEAATAEGVLTIVNANMANAIRSRTVQKGIDPRDFSLVAFGGAGPLHGAEVAAMLGIPEVIVPPYPGITSAVGLLTTDLKYDAIKTEFQVQGDVDFARLSNDFQAMEAELTEQLKADGIDPAAITYLRAADLRYVGQGYELRIPVPPGEVDAAVGETIWQAFHDKHQAEYGHAFADSPIEIVNVRVTGVGEMAKIGQPAIVSGLSFKAAEVKRGVCQFRVDDSLQSFDTVFYARDRLPLNEEMAGPAVILQTDTTTVVPPGCRFTARSDGNLMISIGGSA